MFPFHFLRFCSVFSSVSIINSCHLCFRYHDAGEKAKAKVLELLRGLSAELQTKVNILVFASMVLVIAKALFAHVRLVAHFFGSK